MKRTVIFFASVLFLSNVLFAAQAKPSASGDLAVGEAKLSSVKGNVDVKSSGSEQWKAAKTGAKVNSGQRIKTKARSRVNVELEDGSRMTIYPNSQVDLRSLKSKTPTLKVIAGRIKAWVARNTGREKFEVHTPVAVCSVRGTEFTVDVEENGVTEVEVDKGLVGVRKADGSGEEIPVGAGEKLNITADRPISLDQKAEAMTQEKTAKREVGLDMSKEEVQAAAAVEMRLAEYREGKTMIDAFGARVRLEEYIMRPAADQFKLVVLNERDTRFDYFYFTGTFNKDLPTDLSTALRDMNGTLGTAMPEYYLLSYEKTYSNTQDHSKDVASGGHLVKITCNADGTFTLTDGADSTHTRTVDAYDAADGAYNPITDTFDTTQTSALDLTVFNSGTDSFDSFAAGQTYWNTRFNNYEHIINGVKKQWYFPSNAATNILVMDLDGHMVYPSLDSAGNTIYGEWGLSAAESSYPDASLLHNKIKVTYLDGTCEQFDNYIISDDGKVAAASEFNNITTGAAYKETLLKWNYQQVITASEFNGRKIDLVVEPKILINSGLIK